MNAGLGFYSPEKVEATRRRIISPTLSSWPEARAPHTRAGRTRGAVAERNAVVAERSGSAVGASENASAGAVSDAIARTARAAATHGVNERMTVGFLAWKDVRNLMNLEFKRCENPGISNHQPWKVARIVAGTFSMTGCSTHQKGQIAKVDTTPLVKNQLLKFRFESTI